MGNLSSPLWIVTISPKKGDNCGPLSSTVGKGVLDHLLHSGVEMKDIRFEYLWWEPLSAGGVYLLRDADLEKSVAELKERIKENKPNLILFLGGECLKYFANQKSMMDWSGHVVWNDELNCKTLYSFDPYVAYTQNFMEKDDKPGQYNQLLRNHLRKAADEFKTPEMSHFKAKYVVAPSFTEAREYLLDMLNNAEVISYDIEVLEPYEGRVIDCIGLASAWDKAICIPFYILDNEKLQRYWRNESEFFEIYSLVKQILESEIPKVAQNSQFDTTMLLVYFGIDIRNLVWDTMIAAHNLYCDLPKTLGVLIALYTDLPYHKYLGKTGKMLDRWEYNAADAVANLHVMSGQVKEFSLMEDICVQCKDNKKTFCQMCPIFFNSKSGSHYLQVTNASIPYSVYMHVKGVNVDPTARDKILVEETLFMSSIIEAMNEVLPFYLGTGKEGRKLNPNSSQDKLNLFYSLFNCMEYRKGKELSADKKALKFFIERDKREYVKIFAQALLAFSKSKASISVFRVELDNGRIRTQYDVAGTDTGRLASKKSDVLLGSTNLQNVAKGPQRQMMIPDRAKEEFAIVDLYAAEAYLNALDAGEWSMIEMISGKECPTQVQGNGCRIMTSLAAEDYKIHNWMQRETSKVFPAECATYDYNYKKAKQSIHSLNYGVKPEKMSIESGLPKSLTAWQYAMYHKKFPGIEARMKRIAGTVKSTHMLTTCLFRRRVFIQNYCQELLNQSYAWQNQSTIGELALIASNYLHVISDVWEASDGELGQLCRPSLNTHDGLAIRTLRGKRDSVIPYILNAFRIPLTIHGVTITIPISIGWGDNFNDMKEELVYFYN